MPVVRGCHDGGSMVVAVVPAPWLRVLGRLGHTSARPCPKMLRVLMITWQLADGGRRLVAVVNETEGLGLGVLRMVVVGHNCMQEDVNNVDMIL